MIGLSKKQGKFLKEVIDQWEEDEVINESEKKKLEDSIEIRSFEWKKLAEYSFWIAMVCIVIAFGAMFADKLLIDLVEKIFSSSNFTLCILFAVIALAIYYWAYKRSHKYPNKVYSNEFILIMAILSTATSIGYLGMTLDNGNGHFSVLLLIAAIIYALIGLLFPSKLVWIFAILSLGAWFGAETGYVSGWGAYYLGMNYPLRFVVFGAILTGLSFLFDRISFLQTFRKSTYILGLLYLFIALWILSIFGNYGDVDEWFDVKQISLIWYGVIFGLVAIIAIWWGLKQDDYTSRSFGLTFLFINLYTKYFEYFWDAMHKAIFFLILAGTFWLIGNNAEKIWNLKFLNRKEILED
ncbi:hypothetical protein [Carboxylicivirga caseinilyticus]|uniref:hypothetical protein n=1 Tax=Carboxylicivirga caseinilyticus TaxID=3417572 RepID=UPI003D33C7CF|nr:hypothetical protein [Marinilabiliaceae bacterium A049]